MQSIIDRYWKPLLFIGVVVFLVAQPSYIGWWVYDANTANSIGGEAFYGSRFLALYGPHDTARWLWQWHSDPVFMAVFRQSMVKGFWVAAIAVAAFGYMAHVNGPMAAVETEEQPHRYGTVEDLLALGRVSKTERGIVIGREGKRPVWHTGDDHLLLIGASRVGEKGTSFVLPTLADCPDSLVVFDPKGELFEATADERRKLGPVWLFDVTRAGCAKFNPLQELRGGDLNIADCEMQGQLMTYGMDQHADPFWRAQASLLLAGLVREACVNQARPTYQRVRDSWRELRDGRSPATRDAFVQDRITGFQSLEDRPRSGVQAQVEMALRFTANPATLAALSRSEWHVSSLCTGAQPATVYLTFPAAQQDVHTQVVRLVLQSLFLGLLHHRFESADGRRKRHRVSWMLDEFPALGHLPFIEDAMAVAAGYGLKLFLVCQDIAQIERSYGRDESITKNCGHMVFATLSDSGYDHATKMCGTMIAPMRARHRKVGVFDRQSETASQSRHPVLNPRDARLLTKDHALVLATVGAKPVWLPKARFWEMACYRDRIRDTRWMEAESAWTESDEADFRDMKARLAAKERGVTQP